MGRLSAIAKWGLYGALGIGAFVAGYYRVDKFITGKAPSIIARSDSRQNLPQEEQNHLLQNVPSPLRIRIKKLLKQGIYPCNPILKPLPKNCFETIAWAMGRTFSCQKYNSTDGFIKFLESSGYRLRTTFAPFHTLELRKGYTIIHGLKMATIPLSLKPGDVLLFGAHRFDYDTKNKYTDLVHAAIYLGKVNGQHFIFQKPSFACGKESPYQIIPLKSQLAKRIGHPIEVDDGYDRVFVYSPN